MTVDITINIAVEGGNHFIQPCPTFNRRNTFAWYRERIYKLENEAAYDASDKRAALDKALEWGETIPTGVLFQTSLPTYEEHLGISSEAPIARRKIEPRLVTSLFQSFM